MFMWQKLSDMYQSREYEMFISDKLGNDLYINNPERADRLAKAAEYGANGSTHAETIQDWRDYLSTLKVFDPDYNDIADISRYDLTAAQEKAISDEIDSCEQWHIEHKTIDQQIG